MDLLEADIDSAYDGDVDTSNTSDEDSLGDEISVESSNDESESFASTSSSNGATALNQAKKTNNVQNSSESTTDDERNLDTYQYPTYDEQVSICLESCSASMQTLKRRFIRCSSQATIVHLKKFVAKKVLDHIDKYNEVDILCNGESLGKDHTLKFVYVTRWRYQNPPLLLKYRPFDDAKKTKKDGK